MINDPKPFFIGDGVMASSHTVWQVLSAERPGALSWKAQVAWPGIGRVVSGGRALVLTVSPVLISSCSQSISFSSLSFSSIWWFNSFFVTGAVGGLRGDLFMAVSHCQTQHT